MSRPWDFVHAAGLVDACVMQKHFWQHIALRFLGRAASGIATPIGKLIKKKLGFRTVMNIIPLNAKLVKGSHGRMPDNLDDYPIIITNNKAIDLEQNIKSTHVFEIMEKHVTA